MSLKQKMLNVITQHPKIVTLGIGLVIATMVGIGMGAVDNHMAYAIPDMAEQRCIGCC
jgi:hypothetical protein